MNSVNTITGKLGEFDNNNNATILTNSVIKIYVTKLWVFGNTITMTKLMPVSVSVNMKI